MEQILLYIVTISGFSGLMLGVYSLLVPVLQRRGVKLPFSGRDDGEDDVLDYDDELTFAANSFSARRDSLLERVPRQKTRSKPVNEEEEDDLDLEEELLGDLDLSKELAEVQAEDDGDEDDELAALTFDAEIDPVLEELIEDDGLEEADDEDDEEGEDEEDGEDDEDEYEDEEEEAEEAPQTPVVQVVNAAGGDDFLSLFEEGSDVAKEIEAWRADLPSLSMDELLAEARQIGALLKGRRSRA